MNKQTTKLLLIFCLVRPAPGVMDCGTACQQCQLRDEHPRLLEVYCAMCRECKDRTWEQRLRRMEDQQNVYNLEDVPEGCPPPPPCDPYQFNLPGTIPFDHYCPPPPPCNPGNPDEPSHPDPLAEEVPNVSSLITEPTTTPTTTPTTPTTTPTTALTTTQRPCPPSLPCKKRPRPYLPCYYPCTPMCPCPYPSLTTKKSKLVEVEDTTKVKKMDSESGETTGALYVYVGVPKDVLE